MNKTACSLSCAAFVLLLALVVNAAARPGEIATGPLLRNAGEVRAAVDEARAADAVYRNALYLYLRLAGVGWVTVEWIAAILMWRGYRLLAMTARNRGIMGC
jgi:hypothetical protein